jgi:hypothetical protein
MRGPAYSIPGVDRNSGGMGVYEPDVSSMPPAPAGYTYVVVPGQTFPQLQKVPNQTSPLIGLLILGGAAFAAWSMIGGRKMGSVKLPIVSM